MASKQVEELHLTLSAKIDKLLDRMNKVDKRVKKTSDNAKESNKKMQSAFRETAAAVAAFQGPLGPVAGRINALGAAVGRAGPLLTGLGVVVAGLTIALKKAINAAAQYNRELNRLEGITKATGFSAGLSAASINKFAKELGESTLTSASAAREAAGIIATFKSISGDTFKETLSLAQDLSEAGFGSLRQTSLQLSKALEEPIEGLNALRRSGVSFSTQQKEMIKGFVEGGNKAAAQAEILKVVNAQVGGTGVAAAQGLAGAMDTLGERIQRAWEHLGNTLPAKAAAKAINFVSDALGELLDKIEDVEDGTKLYTEVLEANREVLQKNGIDITKFANQSGTVIRGLMAGIKAQGLDLEENLKFAKLQGNIIRTANQLQNWNKVMDSANESTVEGQRAQQQAGAKIAELNAKLIEQTNLLRDVATGHLTEAQTLKESNDEKERAKALLEQDRKLRTEVAQAQKTWSESLIKAKEDLDPLGAALDNFIRQEEKYMEIANMVNATEAERSLILQHLHDQMTKAATAEEERTKKAEEAAATRRELQNQEFRDRLSRLEEQWMTEEELLVNSFGRQNELVAEALENGAISEQEAMARRQNILEQYYKARDRLTRKQTQSELRNWKSFASTMMNVASKQSKSLFRVFKALNLATAITSTYAAVNKAMAELPWPANLAAAASALASGLANVASIRSTEVGGGGGGGGATPSATASSPASSPTAPAEPETLRSRGRTGPGLDVNINLGDDDDLVSKGAVRRLIDAINEQIDDGAEIRSIRVT